MKSSFSSDQPELSKLTDRILVFFVIKHFLRPEQLFVMMDSYPQSAHSALGFIESSDVSLNTSAKSSRSVLGLVRSSSKGTRSRSGFAMKTGEVFLTRSRLEQAPQDDDDSDYSDDEYRVPTQNRSYDVSCFCRYVGDLCCKFPLR